MEVWFCFGWRAGGGVFCKSAHSYCPLLDMVVAFAWLGPEPVPRNLAKGGAAGVGSVLFMVWFASGGCEGGRLRPAAKAAGVSVERVTGFPVCPRPRGCPPEAQGCRLLPPARLENWLVHIYGRMTLGRQSAVLLVTCVSPIVLFQGSVYVDICLVSPHVVLSICYLPTVVSGAALSGRNSCSVSQQLGCVHTLLGLHINLLFTVYLCFLLGNKSHPINVMSPVSSGS